MEAAYRHCEALVRERDRERFIAALFAPANKRSHLLALYAFDLEVARISDMVREPMAGEIRLQWWREVLEGGRADEAKANPVSVALLNTLASGKLEPRKLLQLIDARQFDLLGQPMPSQEALEQYLDGIFGTIVGLAARLLDPGGSPSAAAVPAGRSLGIVAIFRSLAHDVSRGRLFLPLDILAANGVHTASVFAGEASEGLRATIAYLAVAAGQYLAEVRQAAPSPQILPAFLPLALAPLHLSRITKAADPFASSMELSALRSQFVLWRAARRGVV